MKTRTTNKLQLIANDFSASVNPFEVCDRGAFVGEEFQIFTHYHSEHAKFIELHNRLANVVKMGDMDGDGENCEFRRKADSESEASRTAAR